MLIPSLLAQKLIAIHVTILPPITDHKGAGVERRHRDPLRKVLMARTNRSSHKTTERARRQKTPQTKILTQPERTTGFTSKGAVKPLLQWRLLAFLTTFFFQGPCGCHACMQINLPWFFPLQHSVQLTFAEHIGSSIFPGTLSHSFAIFDHPH